MRWVGRPDHVRIFAAPPDGDSMRSIVFIALSIIMFAESARAGTYTVDPAGGGRMPGEVNEHGDGAQIDFGDGQGALHPPCVVGGRPKVGAGNRREDAETTKDQ